MPVIFYIIAILALVAADQAAKWWVIAYLKPVGSIPVLGDFLQFFYIENRGAAFNFLEKQNQRWLFITVTGILVLFCLYILFTRRFHRFIGNLALILVISGGIGNMIDRVFRGYVVDFIYFKSINFAVFNIADSCVVVGAILVCIYLLFFERSAFNAPVKSGAQNAAHSDSKSGVDDEVKKETP